MGEDIVHNVQRCEENLPREVILIKYHLTFILCNY